MVFQLDKMHVYFCRKEIKEIHLAIKVSNILDILVILYIQIFDLPKTIHIKK